MIALKTIVVPLDGSRFSERALPYALELSSASGARLITLRAAQEHMSLEALVDPIDAKFDTLDDAEAELAASLSRLPKTGVDIEAHVCSGNPAQAIVDLAAFHDAGLIVMATHGRSGLGRWLYGSVADQVIRKSHVPVLLVPIMCEPEWPQDQTRRVLVALDGSPLAEEILGPAGLVADALHAELMLVRVVPPKDDHQDAVAAAHAYLETVAGRLREQGERVRVLALEGHAPEKIASLAREMDARIIAMATHGRGGAARYMLGSVATETLHRSTTPLLVFRPAKVSWKPAIPADDETSTAGPPVSLTVTAGEARLLLEAVELLLSTSEKEEHLAKPLHELAAKLASAAETTAAPAELIVEGAL